MDPRLAPLNPPHLADIKYEPIRTAFEVLPPPPQVLPPPPPPPPSFSTPQVSAEASKTPHPQQTTGRKRRSSTTGSRSVARLNPEQLAKKRQNDREAQKAIRERTRAQIEHLEKRIQEFSAQRPHQELQDVIRQKESVEAENKDIKQRLTSILSIVQPIVQSTLPQAYEPVPAPVASDPAELEIRNNGPVKTFGESTALNGIIASGANNQRQPFKTEIIPSAQLPLGTSNLPSVANASTASRTSSVVSPYTMSPQMPQPAAMTASYPHLAPGIGPTAPFDQRNGSIAFGNHARAPEDKLDLGFVLQRREHSIGSSQTLSAERTPSISSLSNPLPSSRSPFQHCQDDNRPAYSVQSKTLDQCPLDGLLLKFLSDQHQKAAEGVPVQDLAGPPYPDFRALVDPRAGHDAHPLSSVFIELLATFPDVATLPEQVAIVYVPYLR